MTPYGRDHEAPPPLGERIKPAEPPAQAPLRETDRPGVFETPDGKLVTQIPENEKARFGFIRQPADLAPIPCPNCGWGYLCFGDCDDPR